MFAGRSAYWIVHKFEDQSSRGEETMSTTMGQTNYGTTGSQMTDHSEGTVARTIEQQTAKLPSDVFLWAALGSIGTSAMLRLMGKKNASLFVGDWVAPFLIAHTKKPCRGFRE
jgi:hypothetical protein